jgi:hypothetical protein
VFHFGSTAVSFWLDIIVANNYIATQIKCHWIRPKEIKMRILLCAFLLLVLTGLSPISKADNFAFTFVSLDGSFAGSGTFGTLPFDTTPDGQVFPLLQGYFITSLDGRVNGIPMVLVPGDNFMSNFTTASLPLNVPLIPFVQFDFSAGVLSFTLDGKGAQIVDSQNGPLIGFTLFAQPGIPGISSQEIDLQVIDTPEPSILTLLAAGLFGLAVLRQIPRASDRS